MCEKTCLKILLFVFNFLLWLGGGLLVATGVLMLIDHTIVNYLHIVNIKDDDDLLRIAAYVLIAAGGISFFVGLFGCCGAIREHQGLLFVYAALLILILLIEVAGAVLAFYYRSQIENGLMDAMKKQVKEDYITNSTTWTAWNLLQQKMKCCGVVNGSDDYLNSRWYNETKQAVPVSCCVSNSSDADTVVPLDSKRCEADAKSRKKPSDFYYSDGCLNQLEEWAKSKTLILTIIAFALGLSQILGVLLACSLRTVLKTSPGKINI